MEETSALIIDNGSGMIKAGFGGDDAPRAVFPTVAGRPTSKSPQPPSYGQKDCYVGDEAFNLQRALAINRPIQRGIINNWDDMERIWHHTFYNELHVSAEQWPVILTEPPLNPKPNREKMAQIMFESVNVPALYIANSAACALYSSGRHTGVVLESGDGVTHAVPVFEGHALDYATTRLDLGGSDLTEYMTKLVTELGYRLPQSADHEISRHMKELLGQVALDFEHEVQQLDNAGHAQHSFELPDGTVFTLGSARVRCPEVLFQPALLGLESSGIHELVRNAIMKCHVDLQGTMFRNVVLAGGNTMFSRLDERLRNELTVLAPSVPLIKVIAPPDRKYTTWIGASILGSLSTCRDMQITKKEFDECGPVIVHRKCF